MAMAAAFGLLVAGGTVALAQTVGCASSNTAFVAAEAWAFPKRQSPDPSVPKQAQAPQPDKNKPLHVPGSTRTYTLTQLENTRFGAVDWFPQDHPPLPHIVAFGRKSAWACAACHKPDGDGYPSSASLAGLSAAYLREQLRAFRDGQRDNEVMPKEARNLDAADEQAAVQYFSKLKFKSHDEVIETTTVPQTHWVEYVREPDENGAREPIGERIIETAADPKDDALDDARAVYIAYVPPGSIARGAVIATKGVGATPACESCHGVKLQGVGDIPYLAGRSPTFIARELILFREGKRTNSGAAPMRVEVAHLTLQDMIDVAAYATAQKPSADSRAVPGNAKRSNPSELRHSGAPEGRTRNPF